MKPAVQTGLQTIDTIVKYSVFHVFDYVIIKSQFGSSNLQTNLKCELLNIYVLWNTSPPPFFFFFKEVIYTYAVKHTAVIFWVTCIDNFSHLLDYNEQIR